MTASSSDFVLDDFFRGVPPRTRDLPVDAVARENWRPMDGTMSLPVLTLDEAGFRHNATSMLRYAAEHGVRIAPHAKTPMAPSLAVQLVEAGAWGTTVADSVRPP